MAQIQTAQDTYLWEGFPASEMNDKNFLCFPTRSVSGNNVSTNGQNSNCLRETNLALQPIGTWLPQGKVLPRFLKLRGAMLTC